MLADVLDNFRNMCYKIYKPDTSKFLSAPGLAWQAALTDIDMFLTINKRRKTKEDKDKKNSLWRSKINS